jgi:hypothetical protein
MLPFLPVLSRPKESMAMAMAMAEGDGDREALIDYPEASFQIWHFLVRHF